MNKPGYVIESVVNSDQVETAIKPIVPKVAGGI